MRQMHIRRERGTGGEEGNSATSEHANPVLRGKKSLPAAIKIWLQAGKTFSCEPGEERGQTNGALLPRQHFEIPGFTPYRFAVDQTLKTREQWIKLKSYQCFLCRSSRRSCLDEAALPEPRHLAFGKKFLLGSALSPWKLYLGRSMTRIPTKVIL